MCLQKRVADLLRENEQLKDELSRVVNSDDKTPPYGSPAPHKGNGV